MEVVFITTKQNTQKMYVSCFKNNIHCWNKESEKLIRPNRVDLFLNVLCIRYTMKKKTKRLS